MIPLPYLLLNFILQTLRTFSKGAQGLFVFDDSPVSSREFQFRCMYSRDNGKVVTSSCKFTINKQGITLHYDRHGYSRRLIVLIYDTSCLILIFRPPGRRQLLFLFLQFYSNLCFY